MYQMTSVITPHILPCAVLLLLYMYMPAKKKNPCTHATRVARAAVMKSRTLPNHTRPWSGIPSRTLSFRVMLHLDSGPSRPLRHRRINGNFGDQNGLRGLCFSFFVAVQWSLYGWLAGVCVLSR
jgi:hypothetical protein